MKLAGLQFESDQEPQYFRGCDAPDYLLAVAKMTPRPRDPNDPFQRLFLNKGRRGLTRANNARTVLP